MVQAVSQKDYPQMPPWIIALGVGAVVANFLWKKYGATPPATLIDPATGQVRLLSNAPGAMQQVLDWFFPASLSPSQGVLDYIRGTEVLKKTVYNDAAGFPTIGYGHKILPGEPYAPYGPLTSISDDQAEQLFQHDVGLAASSVRRLVSVPLTQGQFDALTDFVFNEGARTLLNSTLLQKLNLKDYIGAAAEFQKYIYAGHFVQPGLITRRLAEAKTFSQGLTA